MREKEISFLESAKSPAGAMLESLASLSSNIIVYFNSIEPTLSFLNPIKTAVQGCVLSFTLQSIIPRSLKE